MSGYQNINWAYDSPAEILTVPIGEAGMEK
jgi:hypothetical protein